MEDSNAYILGTDKEESIDLSFNTLFGPLNPMGGKQLVLKLVLTLDLGCGPGSCSVELTKIVGPEGRIIVLIVPSLYSLPRRTSKRAQPSN